MDSRKHEEDPEENQEINQYNHAGAIIAFERQEGYSSESTNDQDKLLLIHLRIQEGFVSKNVSLTADKLVILNLDYGDKRVLADTILDCCCNHDEYHNFYSFLVQVTAVFIDN